MKHKTPSKRQAFRHLLAVVTAQSILTGLTMAGPPEPAGLPGLPGLPLPSAPSVASLPSSQVGLPAPSSLPEPALLPTPKIPNKLGGNELLNSVPKQDSMLQKGTPPNVASGTPSNKVEIKLLPSLPSKPVLPQTISLSNPQSTPLAAQPNSKLPTSTPEAKQGKVLVRVHESSHVQPSANIDTKSTGNRSSFVPVLDTVQPPTLPLSVTQAPEKPTGPIKMSIGDEGVVDLGVQRQTTEPVLIQRAPELVKPRKYTLTQAVVLAQASDLSDDTSDVSVPSESLDLPVLTPQAQSATAKVFSETKTPESLPVPTMVQHQPVVEPLAKPPKRDETHHVAIDKPPMLAQAAKSQDTNLMWKRLEKVAPERVYDIESLGTYSIDVPFQVNYAASLDSEVCTAFNNGQSITLAGGKPGTTRIAIMSREGDTRVIGVSVVPSGQQFSRPKDELDQVKDLISKLFPDARIQFLTQDSGAIEVRGVTRSEADARKVLELIRKVCLVPIHDKVQVSQ